MFKQFALCSTLMLFGCSAKAGSTDTVNGAVETKVVEIHMTTNKPEKTEENRFHRKKIQVLPLVGGTCSGSFIDNKGDILTARHCVEGFDAFEVVTSDQSHYVASVVAVSPKHDLALLHVDRRHTPFFEPATEVRRGQQVFVLGSPLGITNTLSTGVIARLDGDVTLIDCSALPGNSGGPLFDADGKMVGVVTAGFIVLFGTTHLNMAQSLDAVTYFLGESLR